MKKRAYRPVVPYSQEFGAFLQRKRIAAEMSQTDLAERLGYKSAQVISNWERGLQSPPFNILVRVAEILSVSKSELLSKLLDEHHRYYEQGWKKSNRSRAS